ncbi:hypothetical protein [Burkholderia stagnalis]
MPVDWGDARFNPDDPSDTNILLSRVFRFDTLMHFVMPGARPNPAARLVVHCANGHGRRFRIADNGRSETLKYHPLRM